MFTARGLCGHLLDCAGLVVACGWGNDWSWRPDFAPDGALMRVAGGALDSDALTVGEGLDHAESASVFGVAGTGGPWSPVVRDFDPDSGAGAAEANMEGASRLGGPAVLDRVAS